MNSMLSSIKGGLKGYLKMNEKKNISFNLDAISHATSSFLNHDTDDGLDYSSMSDEELLKLHNAENNKNSRWSRHSMYSYSKEEIEEMIRKAENNEVLSDEEARFLSDYYKSVYQQEYDTVSKDFQETQEEYDKVKQVGSQYDFEKIEKNQEVMKEQALLEASSYVEGYRNGTLDIGVLGISSSKLASISDAELKELILEKNPAVGIEYKEMMSSFQETGYESSKDFQKDYQEVKNTYETQKSYLHMIGETLKTIPYAIDMKSQSYVSYEQKATVNVEGIKAIHYRESNTDGVYVDYKEYVSKYGEIDAYNFYKSAVEIYGKDVNVEGIENRDLIQKLVQASEVDSSQGEYYTYLVETRGKDAGRKYLEAIEEGLNQVCGEIEAGEFLDSLANLNEESRVKAVTNHLGVTSEGLSIGIGGFFQNISYFVEGIFQKEENRIYSKKEYETMYLSQAFLNERTKLEAGLISESENGNKISTSSLIDYTADYGKLLNHNLQISQSIGNMLPSIGISILNPIAGSGAMGVSAGGSGYHSAMVEGYDKGDALAYGTVNGISEVAMEKLLGGIPVLSDTKVVDFKTLGKAMFSEGFEEFVQSYVEAGAGTYILKKDFDFKETTQEAIQSGIYGAITGGIMNIPSLAINSHNMKVIDSKVQSGVISESEIESAMHELIPETRDMNYKEIISEYSNPTKEFLLQLDSMNGRNISEDALSVIAYDSTTTQDFKKKFSLANVQEVILNTVAKFKEKLNQFNIKKNNNRLIDLITEINQNESTMTVGDLKNNLLDLLPVGLSPIEQARYLYLELGKALNFDENLNSNFEKSYNQVYQEHQNLNDSTTIHNKKIICASWAKIYSELLTALNIENKMVGDNPDLNDTSVMDHKWVEFKIKDMCFMADATGGIIQDLAHISSGEKTQNFKAIENYSGPGRYPTLIEDGSFEFLLKEIDRRFNYIQDGYRNILNDISFLESDSVSDKLLKLSNTAHLNEIGYIEGKSYLLRFIDKILSSGEQEKVSGTDLQKMKKNGNIDLVNITSVLQEDGSYKYFAFHEGIGLSEVTTRDIDLLFYNGFSLKEGKTIAGYQYNALATFRDNLLEKVSPFLFSKQYLLHDTFQNVTSILADQDSINQLEKTGAVINNAISNDNSRLESLKISQENQLNSLIDEYNNLIDNPELASLLARRHDGMAISIPKSLEEGYLRAITLESEIQSLNNSKDSDLVVENPSTNFENLLSEYSSLISDVMLKSFVDLHNQGVSVEVPDSMKASFQRVLELQSLMDVSASKEVISQVHQSFNQVVSQSKNLQEKMQLLTNMLNQNNELKQIFLSSNSFNTQSIPAYLEQSFNQVCALSAEIKNATEIDILPKLKEHLKILYPKEFYVISDLHGNMSNFDLVKNKIADNPNSHFFILGDALDRGSQGLEILLQIKELDEAGKITYIPGNHDAIAYDYIRSIVDHTKDISFFHSAEQFYETMKFSDTPKRFEHFASEVKTLYQKGIIKQPISLKQLADWLGSKPIQKKIKYNQKTFALAHAVFDDGLYRIDPKFNLRKAYDLRSSGRHPEIVNAYQNVVEYRKSNPKTYHAPLNSPKNATMIVGHTPQQVVNQQPLDNFGKHSAYFIDTHDSLQSIQGYDIVANAPVHLHNLVSYSVLDQLLQTNPQAILIETLNLDDEVFNHKMSLMDQSIGSRSDKGVYNSFKNALIEGYHKTQDFRVKKLLENVYKTVFYVGSISGVSQYQTYDTPTSNVMMINQTVLDIFPQKTFIHELGHILHHQFANYSIPDNYLEIRNEALKSMSVSSKKMLVDFIQYSNHYIENGFQQFSFSKETRQKIYEECVKKLQNEDIPPSRLNKIAELKCNNEIYNIQDHLAKKNNPNMYVVLDMISSLYQSKNILIDGHKYNLLSGHSEDYYSDLVRCNREDVANYFLLKVNNAQKEINFLKKVFGEAWYQMMESQIDNIYKAMEVK